MGTVAEQASAPPATTGTERAARTSLLARLVKAGASDAALARFAKSARLPGPPTVAELRALRALALHLCAALDTDDEATWRAVEAACAALGLAVAERDPPGGATG
ncbi:MAG: hypothetical protein HY908_23740 [Myxococcales bacterium]|nr:hypothetical protein [Myxococcales bacterium]